MKKHLFGILFFGLVVNLLPCSAQNKDAFIAIVPFYSGKADLKKEYAFALSNMVEATFVNAQRFSLLNRTQFKDIDFEDSLQRGESFIEGLVVEQSKKMGAQYLVSGNLANASSAKQTTKNIYTGLLQDSYEGTVTFSIKITEVETGKIKKAKTFTNNTTGANSENQAIMRCLQGTEETVHEFIDKEFPLSVTIFEIKEKDKKGGVKKLVITGGSEKGFRIGQLMKISEIKEVQLNGEMVERKILLATIEILTVDDENFSTCKVKKVEDGVDVLSEEKIMNPNIRILTGGSHKSWFSGLLDR